MPTSAMYTKESLKDAPVDFRIGAVISDGMWYDLPKWRKIAKVTEDEINDWIGAHLKDGSLTQSPTGAKSYRFCLDSILDWYAQQNIQLGVQLIDSLFPPRIWDGMTEVEGFLSAPIREVGIVSFGCNSTVAASITRALRGVAKVKEFEPGRYKAYCLQATYVREIVAAELKKHNVVEKNNIRAQYDVKRREMVDFTQEFSRGMTLFYKAFGRTLVKKHMETIQIFLPDPEDQESQITLWILTAIEKFDESQAVPFSGYLDSVLQHWPYDLPAQHLGKELSTFQRQRSKAIGTLRKRLGEGKSFTSNQVATEIGIDLIKYNDLEDKHKFWERSRNATTLTWDENSDEKMVEQRGGANGGAATFDVNLANHLSSSVINTALATGLFDDAFKLIEQIDVSELDMKSIGEINKEFIVALGVSMGVA